jgi:hypothetical protein
MRRAPSDLRFLFAQMAPYVSDREILEIEFWGHFFDVDDTYDAVKSKLNALILRDWLFNDVDAMVNDKISEPLSCRTPEQRYITSQIIESVVAGTDRLLFLQGLAGTGQTFMVKTVIAALARQGRRCLITDTTGIAAVQYRGGIIVHSLLKLGIDDPVGDGVGRTLIGAFFMHITFSPPILLSSMRFPC